MSARIFSNRRVQLSFIFTTCILLNINTIFNDYALDDIVVLTQNSLVQKGVDGIPELLKTDYLQGYTTKTNTLTGVRYRPLSLVVFALEYHLFGANPFVSHLLNILLFALLVYLLYILLENLFKKHLPYLAFFSCLLFIVHPVHTEVIANVKGRDEIITFIFTIASLICLVKYVRHSSLILLIISLISFFLALLTKETAVTNIGVVFLLLYFFLNKSLKQTIVLTIPFVTVFAFYMLVRFNIVSFTRYHVNDIANSPYLYATHSQAFATKTYIIFKYISLLLFPHPLLTDYSFNHVPYINIISFKFILSLLLAICLIVIAVKYFKSRGLVSFCILYFLITLSVGTNFVFDFGAIMAERMLFQPSLGFCILLALLFLHSYTHYRKISVIALTVVTILFSVKTIARNNEWKNNETLFLADVKNAPYNARLNLYACEQYIIKANKADEPLLKDKFLNQAIYYGNQSLSIQDKFAYTYLRLGLAYYYKGNYPLSATAFTQAYKLEPDNADAERWSNYLNSFIKPE